MSDLWDLWRSQNLPDVEPAPDVLASAVVHGWSVMTPEGLRAPTAAELAEWKQRPCPEPPA